MLKERSSILALRKLRMAGTFTHFKLHQDYLAQRRESLGKAVTLGCATALSRLPISGVLGDFTRASPPQCL